MLRTTLVMDEDLLREIKRRAAEQGLTMQALSNRMLRQSLLPVQKEEYRLKLRTWDGRLQPGIDLLDRDSLFDAIDPRHPATERSWTGCWKKPVQPAI